MLLGTLKCLQKPRQMLLRGLKCAQKPRQMLLTRLEPGLLLVDLLPFPLELDSSGVLLRLLGIASTYYLGDT